MHHQLKVTISGAEAESTLSIICPHTTADRPCAVHYEHQWPDANTCRCTAHDCPCREGDHGDCHQFGGSIEEVGYTCLAMPKSECWYQMVNSEIGLEALEVIGELTAVWTVDLSGNSFNEPIEVVPVDQFEQIVEALAVKARDAATFGIPFGDIVRTVAADALMIASGKVDLAGFLPDVATGGIITA